MKTSVKPSDCRAYWLWAVFDARRKTLLACASTATRADAAAQSEIWADEWNKTGDPRAATTRVMTARALASAIIPPGGAGERAGPDGAAA